MPMADRNPLPRSPNDVRLHIGRPPAPHPAVLPLDAGERGAGLVVAGQVLAVAAFEAAGVAVDQVGLIALQRLVVDAEPDRRVVAHVVLHDVGTGDQPPQDRHAAGSLRLIARLRLPRLQAIAMWVECQ